MVRGAVERGGGSQINDDVCGLREPRAAAKTKLLFFFQMCKYERRDERLPDIVCKSTARSRKPPVHQSHLMPEFAFQRERSSI